ncbi:MULTISPECIES: DUF3791 domain-containing protein [Bacteroides]|jgi:hypothetical protein|uniref:DUF3791 domain-containing protein n=1 Tax=Bacteroides TaxID=816 RepID=UPI0008225C60|nr:MULTISPECIES: DUF3791 domain-containing protein [Bacteroides]SCI14318.1 Uncharacterised protein [uncultured Bacteroides sp.]
MTDEARQNILDEKFSHIIVALSEQHNISIEQAMDIFYNSTTSQLIEEGVADLHCRSSKYLADVIWDEYMANETNQNTNNKEF